MIPLLCRLNFHDWLPWVSGVRQYRRHVGLNGEDPLSTPSRFWGTIIEVEEQFQVRQCRGCGREEQRRME